MCLVEALKEKEFNTEFRFEILKEERWRESKEKESGSETGGCRL